jgi:predicted transcriptional regulator
MRGFLGEGLKNSCNLAIKMEIDRTLKLMSAKEILLELAEKLPPEATLNDAIYELEFRQAVQQGLDELDRGEGIPIEQVKAKIAAWAGK